MIKGFASKVLRKAFEDGNYRRINPQWRARVELLLDALDAAEKVEDLNLLTLGTHPLKGNRKGEWGMTVTKNWRITFRFEAGDADEVDLEDYQNGGRDMARNLERRPTHPGRLLRGEIEARELNQGQVADLVGVGRRTINEICQGRRPMSTDMAHRIGKLFGNGPTLWVNMQKAIDMWHAEREHSTDYAKIQTLEIAR